jgi:nucleoside-diphosphate-sugar epimerase
MVTFVEQTPFDSESFQSLLTRTPCDLFAHHAASTADYRSANFDVVGALSQNTHALPALLQTFLDNGGKAGLLTGSVFEQDEGVGNAPMAAFSPYGLSKGLTAQVFRYWCEKFNVPLGKFVIPNPFGPYEEPRFCHYMVRSWMAGETPQVSRPRYVRDNIHVDLLARVYVDFATRVANGHGMMKIGPGLYAEAQGAFARRLAHELGPRLGVATPIDFATQSDFPEPAVRINADRPDLARFGWEESTAWDAFATYYANERLCT